MPGNSVGDELFISKIKEIVILNLSNERFGVNELAAEAGLSNYLISKRIHAITGKTVIQFMKEVRLSEAIKLLSKGDLTVAEVAYRTGFGSATYFSTCFTEYYGYSPGKFRSGNLPVKTKIEKFSASLRVALREKRSIMFHSLGLILLISLIITFIRIDIVADPEISDLKTGKYGKSVAILPFRNLSDSTENKYLVDGITEDILSLLVQVKDLKVISGKSVEQYSGNDNFYSFIGDFLHVNYLIEGSIQKSGSNFKIWIRLIDTFENKLVWTETYEGNYSSDIFNFQSNVAKKVAGSINAIVTPEEASSIQSFSTENFKAYDLCMKGWQMRQAYINGDGIKHLELSLNYFDQALKVDTGYIRAFIGKSTVFLTINNYDSAYYYAKKAIRIDKNHPGTLSTIAAYYLSQNKPDSAVKYWEMAINTRNNVNLVWAYFGMGQVYMMQLYDIEKALHYFKKAIDNGGDTIADINREMSKLFFAIGDYQKAYQYLNKSLTLSTSCKAISGVCNVLIVSRQYEKALNFIDSIRKITFCDDLCTKRRKEICSLMGKPDSGLRSEDLLDPDNMLIMNLNLYCSITGDEEKANAKSLLFQVTERLEEEIARNDFPWPSCYVEAIAACYAVLGHKEKALFYLSMLEKMGCSDSPYKYESFQGFDMYRNDSEFMNITNKLDKKRADLRLMVHKMNKKGIIDI